MQSRPLLVLMLATLSAASPAAVDAQSRARPDNRLRVSAWAGGFTTMGGFSEGDDFFRFDVGSGIFDGGVAFGGGIHYAVSDGIQLGLEGLLASPDYTRYDRDDGTELGSGSASVQSLMASARLAGAPGQIAFVASGGMGLFSWDVDELGGRNTDFALDIGVGVEYAIGRAVLFGEYTWWWVYHEKDDAVVTNTARNNLLRAGVGYVLF